jgi:hypothetical protein
MGKKIIEIELNYHGDGSVIRTAEGAFSGGTIDPKLNDDLRFSVHRQVPDENYILNPVPGEDTVEGSFQINLFGNSAGYRELGKYFLAIAELDTSEDPNYHDHFDDLKSEDGRTHLHIIVRKEA